jgi:PAS domain S-box-containing protein
VTRRNFEEMSKKELVRELEKLEIAARRFESRASETDRDRLIHDLHVHQVQLEMQNRELREAHSRLEEATLRYADLYDFAPVGYCTLEPDGRIRELNLTAATLLGAHRAELVGRPFASVALLADREPFLSHMRRCLRGSGPVTSDLELRAGERGRRTVQMISNPVRDHSGVTTAYRTVLVDISKLKSLESRLRLLSMAGERLTSSLEVADLIEVAAALALPAFADLCIIDVASDSRTIERRAVHFAEPSQQAAFAERLLHFTPRPGWQPPQAEVIASGEPVLLSEVSADLRERPILDDEYVRILRGADVRSLMVVPLHARGRTFGALTLAFTQSDRRYSALDLQVAQGLSSRIAMALDNAQLYEDVRRANRALHLSEAKSSGVVAISADAIISIDEQQCITLFNEGAEKIFGYSKGEAIGAPLDILIPERFRAVHRRHVERFAAGEQGARKVGEGVGGVFGLRKNGEEFPADAAISKLDVGDKRVLTVALRDVTEHKRIEREQAFFAGVGKELASSLEYEETLERVVQLAVRELADFCVLYTVEEDGGIRRPRVASRDPSNTWFAELMMRMPVDRQPPPPVFQILETRRSAVMELTDDMLASLEQGEDRRRELERIRPRSVVGVPLVVGDKCLAVLFLASTRSSVHASRDLLVAEEFGRRAAVFLENARLHRAARKAIKARDDVLGVVAHDLRNPLGNVLMYASLLRQSSPEQRGSTRDSAAVIERAAHRMKRLIEDLVDITRMEAGHLSIDRTCVDVGQAVSELVDAQKPLSTSKSLEIRLDLAPGLGEVFADRDRFMQALENLLGNAVKFSRPGGCITVGAERRDDDVLFWVADTGAGIEAEDSLHLFDRFWQAQKSGRQGAGLGLPIVKGIVEAHGGRVWVESQVGVGSTFFFTVPLVPAAKRERRGSESHRPTRTVLVAEDDADARELIGATLERAGYDVAKAANGAEALEYLHREPPPCLVIVDLMMPIKDGWAFLSERNQDPDLRSIPVIVVSGQNDVEDRVVAAHASYVQKPIFPDRLIETMDALVH